MSFPLSKSSLRRVAALAALGMALGCEPKQLEPAITVEDFIPRVTTPDGAAVGVLRTGELPAAAGGPAISASGMATVVNGGSAQVQLAAGSATFERVFVGVRGIPGYWDVTLPAGVSASELVVGISPNLPAGNFEALYAAQSGAAVGAPSAQAFRVIRVGTGDVQVSVSWTGASDVDLHVVAPDSTELYYGHRRHEPTGAELDLDSNAGCTIDNVNNENIVFPTGQAPRGEYIVRVDYWSACDAPRSDYVVTIQVKGQVARTYVGTFTGAGNSGGAGDGREIARFTY
jgi:hypothetical protein